MNETIVTLPTLHSGQVAAFRMHQQNRFLSLLCGRRWGKTEMLSTVISDRVIRGRLQGFFAPDYKIITETYAQIHDQLEPVLAPGTSEVKGRIKVKGGGRIDFWTLNNPRAGRSRKYHDVYLDEIAFAEGDMMRTWNTSIRPTLLDFGGSCIAASTPNGVDSASFFWRICNEPEHGFKVYHAPTHTNPYLPKDELDKLEKENHPLVFRQEYMAEFVDWSGAAFFSLDSMLVDGLPVPMPYNTDQIYAVVDTAVKDGLEHDGTAVTYYAKNKIFGHPLTILDYDVVQISGDLLDQWLPNVLARCEELARLTNARQGSLGAWIEDKATGSVLIQASQRRGWPVQAIDGPLTASGKDGRAMAVAGYVHNGNVKISEYAFNKTITYKNQTKNHFLTQVCGFRLGNKTPHHMDVLDTFTYGVAIGLGDSLGF